MRRINSCPIVSALSVSEKYEGFRGKGFWPQPRPPGTPIPAVGWACRANDACGQYHCRPKGFRSKGPLDSLRLGYSPLGGCSLGGSEQIKSCPLCGLSRPRAFGAKTEPLVFSDTLKANDSVELGSAVVSTAVFGVSPKNTPVHDHSPIGEGAVCVRLAGETPIRATGTVALPNPTAWIRIGQIFAPIWPLRTNGAIFKGCMVVLPKRRSLVTETAETLKKWITDGYLGGLLPGEIRLKARLGVGRDTLRLALKQLEEEHWISATGRGRQRCVEPGQLPRRHSAPNRHLPVTFLSPFPMVDRIMLLELEDLHKHLAEQGRELRFISSSHLHSKRAEQHLKRLVGENPSAAWLLHFVSETTQRWFEQQGLPAFIYGTPFPGVNLPFVVNDWESAAFHACLQLTRQRHRVLAQMAFEHMVPGMLAIERGLRRGLAALNAPNQLLIFKDDHSPQSVVRSLEKAFGFEPRPTALVFCASSQLLTCYSWMTSKRIAVPEDVSLVSIPSASWFQDLCPPVCHYENNPKTFARFVRQKVMELVEHGHVARGSIRVRMEYKAGATIGPVPAPDR
jgi:DNA-binding LacI/PurR family transcriptional regulator